MLYVEGGAGCGSYLHTSGGTRLKTNKNLVRSIMSTKFGSDGGILGAGSERLRYVSGTGGQGVLPFLVPHLTLNISSTPFPFFTLNWFS